MGQWMWGTAMLGLFLAACGGTEHSGNGSPEDTGGAPGNTGGTRERSGGAPERTGGGGERTDGSFGGSGGFRTDVGGDTGGSGGFGGGGGSGSTPSDGGPLPPESRWDPLLHIMGIARGNGVYVAVGSELDDREDTTPSAAMFWSSDGFYWNGPIVALPSPATDVTYGNGAFVAIASRESSALVYRSEDGIYWTVAEVEGAASRTGESLAFGNGVFVATLGDRVIRSTDGKSWQSAPHTPLDGIEFGAGTFVVWSKSQFESSKNGVDWALSEPVRGKVQYNYARLFGSERGFEGILGYYCCFGEVSPRFATIHSDDGFTWTLDEDGGATVPALREANVCVTYSRYAFVDGSFAVGTTCSSANPLPTKEGFTPLLVHHDGPSYLFGGYAGIYASKDGIHYEPTLLKAQNVIF